MKRRTTRPIALGAAVAVFAVAIGVLAPLGLSAPEPSDSITANRFSLTIDGYEIAAFSELSGITTEVEPTEYLPSNSKELVLKKIPGRAKPPTITLKRGMNGGLELWAWHEAVRSGDMAQARRSVSLTMYNTEGEPVARYHLENAWPSKLDIGGLKAGAEQVLIETVTLSTDRIQRIAP